MAKMARMLGMRRPEFVLEMRKDIENYETSKE